MNDISEILEQYDIEVINIYRGRGMFICKLSNDKLISVKELSMAVGRLLNEHKLKEELAQNGFSDIDKYLINKNGQLYTLDKYKTPYVIKDYFDGKECDIRSKMDIKNACEKLASFHKASRNIVLNFNDDNRREIEIIFDRHNKELKRVRNYMKTISKKNKFENIYIQNFDLFYKQGMMALEKFVNLKGEISKNKIGICHGSFNQHNVLKTKKGLGIINFEKFNINYQLMDLYDFIRKVLEKNNYSMDYAKMAIEGYDEIIKLEKEAYLFLYLLFSYPEKFWKVSDHYYNMRKTWIPPKNIQKLEDVIIQNEKKQFFLNEFLKEYLVSYV